MTPSAMITLLTVALLMAFGLGLLILAMYRAAGSVGSDTNSNRYLLEAGDQSLTDPQPWMMHGTENPPETGSSTDYLNPPSQP